LSEEKCEKCKVDLEVVDRRFEIQGRLYYVLECPSCGQLKFRRRV